ncbi:MAG: cytochrome c-type biogenesis CcmF C-terminal domain-containing protein, partial [Moraxellaceae bacterium]|nr:cytochrome c-type biogenesis CcmF C-terminal domain-containing protein [Moraxellaceae bacterium]
AKVRSAKAGALAGLRRLSRSYVGMQVAHLGLVISVLGVAFTSAYSIERDVRMAPGESVEMGAYRFVFLGTDHREGPNYSAEHGVVDVYRGERKVKTLEPEKRFYHAQRNTMTEAAIDAGLFRDLYIAMGEPLGEGAWAVRIYHKPFIRWIWLGSIFMAAGGLLAMMDRRYRLRQKSGSSVAEGKVA